MLIEVVKFNKAPFANVFLVFELIILILTLSCAGSAPVALDIVTISPVIIKLPFLTAATLLLVELELWVELLVASSTLDSSLSFFSTASALTELTPPVILLKPPEFWLFPVGLLVFGVVGLLVFGVTGDWDGWPPVVDGTVGLEVVPPCGLVPFPTPEPLFWFPPLCEVPVFPLVVVDYWFNSEDRDKMLIQKVDEEDGNSISSTLN